MAWSLPTADTASQCSSDRLASLRPTPLGHVPLAYDVTPMSSSIRSPSDLSSSSGFESSVRMPTFHISSSSTSRDVWLGSVTCSDVDSTSTATADFETPLCMDNPLSSSGSLPPLRIDSGDVTICSTSGAPLGFQYQSRAQALLTSFRQTIVQSVRVVLLLLIRALLTTGVPMVRRGLGSLGLGGLVAEAEKDRGVEEILSSSGREVDPVRPQAPLLPPRHGDNDDRLTIVLDLDETLVCAYNTVGLPSQLHEAACNGGIKWFTLDCVSADELDEQGHPRVHNVTVYQRPGLQEFLAAASQLGELVLFTAGLEGYARPLVDKIDPEGRITYRLYRSATVSTYLRDHVKDLSLLGRNPRRTVLIDNNPFSFLLQPLNGVPCVAFTGEDAKDQQLQDVLLPLLKELDLQADVRPHLMSRFQMPQWFRVRGIPVMDSSTLTLPWTPLTPPPVPVLSSCTPLTPVGAREEEGRVFIP